MNKRSISSKSFLICTISLLAALGAAGNAMAANVTCSNQTLGAISVTGNVRVAANRTCTLNGTRVTGNVELMRNSNVNVNGAKINGNIVSLESIGPNSVKIRCLDGFTCATGKETRVANVQISFIPTTAPVGPNYICGALVHGNIQLNKNRRQFVIGDARVCSGSLNRGNSVSGDVQVFTNNVSTSRPAAVISDNNIRGNLQCKENIAMATGIPSSNAVGGNAEDECANLGREPAMCANDDDDFDNDGLDDFIDDDDDNDRIKDDNDDDDDNDGIKDDDDDDDDNDDCYDHDDDDDGDDD